MLDLKKKIWGWKYKTNNRLGTSAAIFPKYLLQIREQGFLLPNSSSSTISPAFMFSAISAPLYPNFIKKLLLVTPPAVALSLPPPFVHNRRGSCTFAAATVSSPSVVTEFKEIRSPELVAREYADLNLLDKFCEVHNICMHCMVVFSNNRVFTNQLEFNW